MKKVLLILLFALLVFSLHSQNCSAFYTVYADQNYFATFTDQSTASGNITDWNWSYGDGSSGTGQTPTHQYSGPGLYMVCLTISTDDGCSDTFCDSLVISSPNPCAGFYFTSQVTPCSGQGIADGKIEVFTIGGTPPFSYLWNTGSTTSALSGLSSGTYCVTVKDDIGCTLTDCITVGVACNISLTSSITNETYAGAHDGAIDITVSGGTAPYNFYWTNGAYTEDISGLSSGTYTVYISDKDSCDYLETFYVSNNATSVNKNPSLSDFKTYPNPVKNNLNISMNSLINENVQIRIYNSIGQIIINQDYSLTRGINNINLNVSDLKQGIYYLKINDYYAKFLKQ